MPAPGPFIPLALGSSAEGEKSAVFRAHVVKTTDDTRFEPLASLLPAPACGADPAGPRVELERNGRTITRIRIICTCGQVIELDCRYQTAP
ncbi:hypothetical protein NXS98_10770 [Fontisphaera persica]|uniref:hypothetical protein n=1 Tax=Fontisphaera persica TaxID=2974023 RepID=UPI0024C0AFFB|nr:hypothetical protein [Fontisphaera persica]WCJ58207.1 hypothetical protein NXS98_10770 [Fontisphaera persica]